MSDKKLKEAAWDRVISADANLGKRALAVATTGGIWLKKIIMKIRS